MKISWCLLGLSVLYLSVESLLPPTSEDLNRKFALVLQLDTWGFTKAHESVWSFTEISLLGEKYLDKQIENAIEGVKEMKTVMERSGEDHKRFVSELEKTKEEKEVRQTYYNIWWWKWYSKQ